MTSAALEHPVTRIWETFHALLAAFLPTKLATLTSTSIQLLNPTQAPAGRLSVELGHASQVEVIASAAAGYSWNIQMLSMFYLIVIVNN